MPKCLMMLFGESYRHGAQTSRVRGVEGTFETQKLACLSHLRLMNYFQSVHGIGTDVIIHSYKLNETYDNALLGYYGDHLLYSVLRDNMLSSYSEMHGLTRNMASDQIQKEEYTFVFFLRLDVFLKKYLFQVFHPANDKILYMHVDSNGGKNINMVLDYIIHVPQALFHVITEGKLELSHWSATQMMWTIGKSSIGLVIDTPHWCSTDLGWNPLYIQVGRGEKLEYLDYGLHYDLETDTTRSVENETCYSDLMFTDTLEENLENSSRDQEAWLTTF